MLSLIEVTCPHCAAQGQIMLPPLGSIIIGPCPECQEMVAVFCGRVLALDSTIMSDGSNDEKRSHVGAVLGDFLHRRVDRLFSDMEADAAGESTEDTGPVRDSPVTNDTATASPSTQENQAQISNAELASFVNVDLRLLDNHDYFRAIFDPE